MKIIAINTAHSAVLVELARSIYREYYLHLWNPGGADWYMYEYAYTASKLEKELADPNNLHYIVYNNDQQPTGYLKIRINAVLEGFEDKNCLEIERIYLHKSIAGKGIGKNLMLFSEDIAKLHNKNTLFLKAMDSSADAIAFYQKLGYAICGTLTLPFPQMKEEFRGMVILRKEI